MKDHSMHHHYQPQPCSHKMQTILCSHQFARWTSMRLWRTPMRSGFKREPMRKCTNAKSSSRMESFKKITNLWLIQLHQAHTTQQKLIYELLENAKYILWRDSNDKLSASRSLGRLSSRAVSQQFYVGLDLFVVHNVFPSVFWWIYWSTHWHLRRPRKAETSKWKRVLLFTLYFNNRSTKRHWEIHRGRWSGLVQVQKFCKTCIDDQEDLIHKLASYTRSCIETGSISMGSHHQAKTAKPSCSM